MFARTMNPLDQSNTFDEPFSIPSSGSHVHHAILPFLLPTSGRSAAKAAPAIPRTNKANCPANCKSKIAFAQSPVCSGTSMSRPWMLPPRNAPIPTATSLDCPAAPNNGTHPRRASCADASAVQATCRPSRWERLPAARKRTAHSADRWLANAADAAPPPPGMPGCRARYNFQIGLGLAVDDLRRRRREEAGKAPLAPESPAML